MSYGGWSPNRRPAERQRNDKAYAVERRLNALMVPVVGYSPSGGLNPGTGGGPDGNGAAAVQWLGQTAQFQPVPAGVYKFSYRMVLSIISLGSGSTACGIKLQLTSTPTFINWDVGLWGYPGQEDNALMTSAGYWRVANAGAPSPGFVWSGISGGWVIEFIGSGMFQIASADNFGFYGGGAGQSGVFSPMNCLLENGSYCELLKVG